MHLKLQLIFNHGQTPEKQPRELFVFFTFLFSKPSWINLYFSKHVTPTKYIHTYILWFSTSRQISFFIILLGVQLGSKKLFCTLGHRSSYIYIYIYIENKQEKDFFLIIGASRPTIQDNARILCISEAVGTELAECIYRCLLSVGNTTMGDYE